MSPVKRVVAVFVTGADSVVYLSLEGLVKSVSSGRVRTPVKLNCDEKVCLESVSASNCCHSSVADSDQVCVDGQHGFNGKPDDSISDVTESLKETNLNDAGYCLACLNGEYPVPIDW